MMHVKFTPDQTLRPRPATGPSPQAARARAVRLRIIRTSRLSPSRAFMKACSPLHLNRPLACRNAGRWAIGLPLSTRLPSFSALLPDEVPHTEIVPAATQTVHRQQAGA